MKKILIIATSPLANDGITKIEMDVWNAYKSQIKIEIACSFGFDNVYGNILKKNKANLYKLPFKKHVINYMFAIGKLVRDGKYDVVYIHGNSAMMFFESFPVKLFTKSKVITHCHNTKSNYPLLHYMLKPLFNLTVDTKIGCSSLAAKWAYCGKHIVVIPNGIEIDKMKFNIKDREKIRGILNVEKDETLIGNVGRFIDQKNHKKIVSVFKQYINIDKKSKLLLIGDGPDKRNIINMVEKLGIKNKVIFISSTNEIQIYYSAMDVFFMPSLFEGLGLAVLEAQANGLPVVISNILTSETSVTQYVKSCDLRQSDSVWATLIWESKGEKHYELNTKEKEQLDRKSMMETIGKIIME